MQLAPLSPAAVTAITDGDRSADAAPPITWLVSSVCQGTPRTPPPAFITRPARVSPMSQFKQLKTLVDESKQNKWSRTWGNTHHVDALHQSRDQLVPILCRFVTHFRIFCQASMIPLRLFFIRNMESDLLILVPRSRSNKLHGFVPGRARRCHQERFFHRCNGGCIHRCNGGCSECTRCARMKGVVT